MDKCKILIATFPFAKNGSKPLDLLKESGCELIFNPHGRRLKAGEVEELIKDVDAVIAGTEPYPIEAIKKSRLKVISRVGIGLDNIPLKECRDLGVKVTYTPDAPSQAVAELTIANIINLARYIQQSNQSVRLSAWNRYMGWLLSEMMIGVIGVGRIGKILIKLLQPFQPKILACDLKPDYEFGEKYNLIWCSKEEILYQSKLVTLHIPGNKRNYNFIDRNALALMRTGSFLINTSRGVILDEKALYDALVQKHLAGAALDVFEKEPYEGSLTKLNNVIFTAHMGASANESRFYMELGAVEDCINVLNRNEPKHDAILENSEELEYIS